MEPFIHTQYTWKMKCNDDTMMVWKHGKPVKESATEDCRTTNQKKSK